MLHLLLSVSLSLYLEQTLWNIPRNRREIMRPIGFIQAEWKVGQWIARLVFKKLTTTLGNALLS